MQLMLGDVVLMKLNIYQGKRKVKDRWSKVEYVFTCGCEGGGESIYVGATRSALAELTPLECSGEMSESDMEGVLTQHPSP